jgi:hypothetical protein
MTVQQAYQIDQKVDDGAPTTGNVTAIYDTGGLTENAAPQASAATGAPNAVATDCYDSTTTPNYDVGMNNGAGANCALSFRFQ